MTRPRPRPRSRLRATGALAASALAGVLALTGCSGGGDGSGPAAARMDGAATADLTTSDAYVPEPPTTELAGGFLRIANHGGEDATLTSVTSPLAKEVQLHVTKGGRMERVPTLTVPAGGTLDLDRGGNHLMLLGLKDKPVKGEKVEVVLHFAQHGRLTLDVPVRAATYTGAKAQER